MKHIIFIAVLLALLSTSVKINFMQSDTIREQNKCLSKADSLVERADSLIREIIINNKNCK